MSKTTLSEGSSWH